MSEGSWLWTYIVKNYDEFGTLCGYSCEKCEDKFSAKISYTNLGYHLNKSHKIFKEKVISSQSKQEKLEQCGIERRKKYSEKDFLRQLSLFIASNNLSLSIVESPNFNRFCEMLNPEFVVPSRKKMRDLLIDYANEEREGLIEALKPVDYISISCDLWTSTAKDPFLGIKVHYSKDFCPMEHVLCCKSLPFPHTGDAIAKSIEVELKKYKIREKIKFIICDNASNIQAAIEILKIPSIPCAIHTIQCTVKQSLKLEKLLLEKVRKLVKFFTKRPKQKQRLSEYRAIINKESKPELILDTDTRWNSTFLMLSRLSLLYDDIIGLKNMLLESSNSVDKKEGSELDDVLLTPIEMEEVNEYSHFLEPFKNASELIEASKMPTLSFICPITPKPQYQKVIVNYCESYSSLSIKIKP